MTSVKAEAGLRLLATRQPALVQEVAGKVLAKRTVDGIRHSVLPLEGRMTSDMAKLLGELGDVVHTAAQASGGLVVEEASAREHTRVENIMTLAQLRGWVTKRMTPRFVYWWEQAHGTVVKALQDAGVVGNVRGQLARHVLQQGGRRAGLMDIAGDTRKALLRVLDTARDSGLGPRDAARLIREYVPEGRFVNAGASYRANMIARTEMMHAQRVSSLAAYRVTDGIGHVIAYDGDMDEICAGRNGTIFTLDDAEAEMASTHPSCVLTFGPVSA